MYKFIFTLFLSLPAYSLVDMRSAGYMKTFSDMLVSRGGFDLKVERTYASRSLFNGIFGFGWCSNFETKIEVLPDNTIKAIDCGGGRETVYFSKGQKGNVNVQVQAILNGIKKKNFKTSQQYLNTLKVDLIKSEALRSEFLTALKLEGTAKANTKYFAEGKADESIEFKGGKYTRRFSSGVSEVFDKSGRLAYVYDKNGNYIQIKYAGSKISEVVDNKGQRLKFSFNSKNNKVSQIRGSHKKVVSFAYKGEDLTRVKNAWGEVFTYKYDELHNLKKINYPDKTVEALTYNKDKDWVTSFKNRKKCLEKYSYKKDKKNPNHYWSEVTKTCGKKVVNKSRYEFWHKKSRDGGAYLSRARSRVNGKVTDVSYHPRFGLPVSVFKNGIKVRYNFFNSGLLKSREEANKAVAFSNYNAKCKKPQKVIVSYKNSKGKTLKTVTTRAKFDSKKCVVRQVSNSSGQAVSIIYDSKGRISKMSDQSKKKIVVKYNEKFSKPSLITRPGVGSLKIQYDKDGNVRVNKNTDYVIATQVSSIFNNFLQAIAPIATDIVI